MPGKHREADLGGVRLAEELGFDSVWTSETYGSDALTPLAFIAALSIKGIFGAFVPFPAKALARSTARPDADGREYQDLAVLDRDFAMMAAYGFNAVRIPFCPNTLQREPTNSIDFSKNPQLEGLDSLEVLDGATVRGVVTLQGMRTDAVRAAVRLAAPAGSGRGRPGKARRYRFRQPVR